MSKRLTTKEFIEKSKKVHGDKYDYSKVEYINCETKVCIICPEHGEFWQTPNVHLCGKECPKCNQSKLENEITCNFPDFINQKEFEWLKYKKPMKLDFYDNKTNIGIIMPRHSTFCSIENFWRNRWIVK